MSSRIKVCEGDSRELIKTLPDNSSDAVVSDPPYALESIVKRFGGVNAAPATDRDGVFKRSSRGFMGQAWDTGEVAHDPAFWAECLRVLKPGGWVVAFAGTRTYHRLAMAIELAGFEVRDQIQWLYGSGFPKSHDVSKGIDRAAGAARVEVGRKTTGKTWGDSSVNAFQGGFEYAQDFSVTAPATPAAVAWDGWGTALKPACEPIVLARKALDGTVAANVQRWGTGALNIAASRVPVDAKLDARDLARETTRGARAEAENGHTWGMNGDEGGVTDILNPDGRWPANVLHDGSAEVLAAFPAAPGALYGTGPKYERKAAVYGEFASVAAHEPRGDAGSAARFFNAFPWTPEDDALVGGQRFLYHPKAGDEDRMGSVHPTVKPIALMAWLTRLVCREGGVILDPFAGSGTTGQGAMRVGVGSILFEREPAFAEDCRRRARYAHGEIALEAALLARVEDEVKRGDDLPLFGAL